MLFLCALRALPSSEVAVVEARLSSCEECRQEMEALRPIVGSFVSWPTDVLRPSPSLWERLAHRIAKETGKEPMLRPPELSSKLQWEEVAPGICVKILASDPEKDRASMLVRLDPGTDYPAHEHAEAEELYLLHGELKIDDRTLYAGDFIRAEAGSIDHRVWSETGCTCVLLASTRDSLL